jgi:hypothetical protein
LLLTLLVYAGVAAFLAVLVAMALVFRAPRPPWEPEIPVPESVRRLQREREMSLRAIKDLDFEHACGSVSEDEYARLREEHKKRAVEATTQLRAIEDGRTEAEVREARPTAALLAQIEAEIAEIKGRIRGPS